jgi:hypothetical protein
MKATQAAAPVLLALLLRLAQLYSPAPLLGVIPRRVRLPLGPVSLIPRSRGQMLTGHLIPDGWTSSTVI